MRLKIQGGTVRHGEPSLCVTCRHATVIHGPSLKDRIVDCGLLMSRDSRISFPVSSCSGYADRRHPTLREMEDIAWVLRTDARRKSIGFVQARELKPRHRHILSDDWDE
ncbi:MAG TPA: hypothetical protein VII62_13595 [Vicinamibacteria bacterium]|jgi:hypothetical protein